jgi:hypothetical protein
MCGTNHRTAGLHRLRHLRLGDRLGGTAGPTGATVMLTLTLSTLGLPMEDVGLLLAVDPIPGMIRTVGNVAGQALVPVLASAYAEILDRTKYDNASAAPAGPVQSVYDEPQPAAPVSA